MIITSNCEVRGKVNSVFAILSHAEVCELILSSTKFSLYQICHHPEFSLLLLVTFFTIVLLITGIYYLRYYFYLLVSGITIFRVFLLVFYFSWCLHVNATLASYSTTRLSLVLVSIIVANVLPVATNKQQRPQPAVYQLHLVQDLLFSVFLLLSTSITYLLYDAMHQQ
jgi:hypothetical protein